MMDDGRSTRGYASIGAVGGYARDSPSIAIEADVIAFFFFSRSLSFFFFFNVFDVQRSDLYIKQP